MPGKGCTAAVAAAVLLAVAGTGVGAQSPAADPVRARGFPPGAILVLNGTSSQALLIDPATGRVTGRFQTGPDPRGVALSPDGRYAYVTSYGWQPTRDVATGDLDEGVAFLASSSTALSPVERGVTVVDLARREIHAVFQPGTYRMLSGIRVGKGGRRLWMVAEADSAIVELDAVTGQVRMLWKTGGANPASLTLTRDNRRIFASSAGSDLVTMIDRVTVVPQRIAVGRRPLGLALSPDERELWVANSGDHTVSVIGTRRFRVTDTFSSGGVSPSWLRFYPSGSEVWVSHRGSHDVTVLDRVSAAVLASIPVEGEPGSIAFSGDGSLAFVSVPARHRVLAIDVAARAIVASLDGGTAPGALVWSGLSRTARGLGR